MVARGEASLEAGRWERGRESQLRNACQRRSLSGGREGGREGGSDSRGKRVRGWERSERDGHRCKYRQHRRNLNTSPEAFPRAKVTIGLTLSIALSLCLSFFGNVSLSVLPYTILL